MKKYSSLLLAMAGVVMYDWSAFAAQAVSVQVVMTVQDVAVTNGALSQLSVSVAVGTSAITSPERSVFSNSGNAAEDFGIMVASSTGGWGLYTSTSDVPSNMYRLRAIWAPWDSKDHGLSLSNFDNDDIITDTTQWSNANVFWTGSTGNIVGTTDPINQANDGGDNVPVGAEKSLFFRFDAGAAGTSGAANTAYVTVSARITQ